MNNRFPRRARLFAAGSLTAIVVIAGFVPFNMGGCGGLSVGGGSIGGHGIPRLGGGGGGNSVDVGKAAQGIQQVGKGLFADTEENEPALGQGVAVQITNHYPLYRDQNLTRYVTLVGRTVAKVTEVGNDPNYVFYFGILDTDDVNAFSGPHGYIFITRGALKRMQDESELAGVLGHEIGHVCKHHGMKAVQNSDLAHGAMSMAASSSKVAAEFAAATDVASDLVFKGYSQGQESEADAASVVYVTAAGYDPNGFLRFLQRMADEQGKGTKLFSSHPGIKDRVKAVDAQIAKSGAGGQGQTLADRFKVNVPNP